MITDIQNGKKVSGSIFTRDIQPPIW